MLYKKNKYNRICTFRVNVKLFSVVSRSQLRARRGCVWLCVGLGFWQEISGNIPNPRASSREEGCGGSQREAKEGRVIQGCANKMQKNQGSRRMLCEISYTAVTYVVTQHSLQVLLKIRQGFCRTFFIWFCFVFSLHWSISLLSFCSWEVDVSLMLAFSWSKLTTL